MGAAVTKAVTTLGALVSKHGDTITRVKDTAGKVVQVSELPLKAANADYSLKDAVNTGLDALSLAAAGAGTIPGINLGTVPVQAILGAAKTANCALHGDMAGAKGAAIEGAVMTGASVMPGGGVLAKVSKGALIVGGEVAKHVVASNDPQFDPAAVAPAKTPGKPGDVKARHS